MRSRLRTLLAANLPVLHTIEAAVIGMFFIQALRFLAGTLYARIGSASLYPTLNPAQIDESLPGLIEPSVLNDELMVLMYLLALPLVALFLGRFRGLIVLAASVAAAGRYFMVGDPSMSPTVSSAIAVGGGLFYLAMIIRHRASTLPVMIVLALGLDQLIRAAGNTLDPSWSPDYASTQLVLSVGVLILAAINGVTFEIESRNRRDDTTISPENGLLTLWGGVGLGALFFLQLSLLALPNAAAERSGTDYTLMVPALLAATLLPLVPWVRLQARRFISLFDTGVRGWSWMLLIMLLAVLGIRFEGIVGGVALVAGQFVVTLLWWWLARPQAQRERNFSALWIVISMLVFGLLFVFDVFTYEYAFVRDFTGDLTFLNPIIPPLLRGFEGMGVLVLLFAAFLAALPMVQMRRRVAWQGGTAVTSLATLALTIGFAVAGGLLAQPPVVQGLANPETIRIGTYNIHAGYNEFYHYDLEAQARTIQQSGANVVLLQEVEAGRMTSFGVHQALWLARRLGMDVRFYPTIEGTQGLALLSNIEIVYDDGVPLDGIASRTGLQRVQVRPDAGVVTIYNTWLDPLLDTGTDLDDAERSQQMQLNQIFAIITAQHQPDGQLGRTIIGGTFNNVPDSDLLQRMRDNGFMDFFAGQQPDAAATFWRTGTRARLDYLWTTRNLQAIRWGVIDTHASDHRLAVIEIAMR